MHVKHVLYQLS